MSHHCTVHTNRTKRVDIKLYKINELMINASRTYRLEVGSIACGICRLTSYFQKIIFQHIEVVHANAPEINLRSAHTAIRNIYGLTVICV